MGETRKRKRRGSFRVNARGWIYLVLTVSVAFSAAFKGNNLLFAIFSILFGLFVISGVLTFVVARRIELARVLPEAVCAGEIFTVGLRLKNAKRLWPAFCLKFEDRLSSEGRPAAVQPTPLWLPIAPPGKRVRGTYYVSAHERGWARLGPFTVTSEFTPGLFTYKTLIPAKDRLLVYPRLGHMNRRILNPLLSRVEYSEMTSNDFVRGEEEFAGLREFREGDSLRRVHWKMSARLPGRLLVKEHEDPRVRDAAILLETFVPNPNDHRRRARLERAVTFCATLADALLAENYHVRFRAFNPGAVALSMEPRRGALDELLYTLALLRPTRVHSLTDLLAAEEGPRKEVFFVLRISDDPVPAWEHQGRSVTIDASEMKDLMDLPS